MVAMSYPVLISCAYVNNARCVLVSLGCVALNIRRENLDNRSEIEYPVKIE